jgi:hypothetical protein
MYQLKQATLARALIKAFGIDEKSKAAAAVLEWCGVMAPRGRAGGAAG